MPPVLFIVHTSIAPEKEEAFNRWYNHKHLRDILRMSGAVGARRYRRVLGDDEHQYIAIYEYPDQETLEAWRVSEDRETIWAEHQELFGPFAAPTVAGYEQIWP